MKRSLNEVASALKKAARGAGYPIGIAEDIARAGIALIEAARDGLAGVAEALPKDGDTALSQSALGGIAILECLLAGDETIEIRSLDAPLLFEGMALHLAREHQTAFRVQWHDGEAEIPTPPGGASFAEAYGGGPLSIFRLTIPASASDAARAIGQGVEINEDLWPLINRWAMETCVPASEHSRLSGAGAGLNDND